MASAGVRPVPRSTRRAGGGVASPDGRWLAYTGRDEPGLPAEIFVSPLANPELGPDAGVDRGRLATAVGEGWPRAVLHGRGRAIMRVPIAPGPTFSAGTPVALFARRYYNGLGLLERPGTYDVAPDGKRFLVLKQGEGPDEPAAPATVVVVKNWIAELRRLIPTGG